MAAPACTECGTPLPPDVNAHAEMCSGRCRMRRHRRRAAERTEALLQYLADVQAVLATPDPAPGVLDALRARAAELHDAA